MKHNRFTTFAGSSADDHLGAVSPGCERSPDLLGNQVGDSPLVSSSSVRCVELRSTEQGLVGRQPQ